MNGSEMMEKSSCTSPAWCTRRRNLEEEVDRNSSLVAWSLPVKNKKTTNDGEVSSITEVSKSLI